MKATAARGSEAKTAGATRRPSRGFALRTPAHGVPAALRESNEGIVAPFGTPAVPVQARLEIGPVDHPLEREADSVATAIAGRLPARTGRVRPHGPSGGTVNEVLATSGQPLDPGIQRHMGAAFGRDFNAVRVHADQRAAGSAASIGARAYTFGNHIAFGHGHYAPGRAEGNWLIAHELAHVVQQRGGGALRGSIRGTTALSEFPAPAIQRADEGELAFLDGWVVEHTASAVMGGTTWHFLREILRGFVGGSKKNLKEGGGDHIVDRLKSLLTSPSAMGTFYLHYVIGLAKGLVSPIVDLWHLISGAFKLQMQLSGWMIDKATEVFRRPNIVIARARDVIASVDQLAGKVGKLFEEFINDPVKSAQRLSGWVDSMMEKALGQARAKGHDVADAMFRFIDLAWGEMGDKIGSVIGAVLVQILMMVFSEGIGNLVTEAGAILGRAGAMIGAEALNVIRAAGAFLTKAMEGVKALGSTVMKAFEGIFADLMKLFEKMKALIEVAAEEFQLGKLATAGEAGPEAMISKATRFEPKGTRTTMTTVEELTGKGPKGATKARPKSLPEGAKKPAIEPRATDLPRAVEQRGKDILEIFEEGQEAARPGSTEAEFTGQRGRGERAKPGGAAQPKRFEVGNFCHEYAEELCPELRGRTLDAEFKIPESARRIDRVDWKTGELIEVKPNVKEWMDAGEEQLKLYKMHMDQKFPRPGGWKTKLATYDRDAVYSFLQKGWPKK